MFTRLAICKSSINLCCAYRLLSKSFKMPSAVVVLPPGAEEMEFVGTVDVLRRAGVTTDEFIENSIFNSCLSSGDGDSGWFGWYKPSQVLP